MLYVGRKAVLTYGEWNRLAAELPEGWSHPVLSDLYVGEPVYEDDVAGALDISARLAAASEEADQIIDTALARLGRADQEG